MFFITIKVLLVVHVAHFKQALSKRAIFVPNFLTQLMRLLLLLSSGMGIVLATIGKALKDFLLAPDLLRETEE